MDDLILKKKKELEYQRVKLGLMDSELKLLECKANIERLEAQIVLQKTKLAEIESV